MAKVAKIKLNRAGVRRLLKSKEMQAICTEHAEEIAARCGISRSYVSRIEKRALEKLEEAIGERG